MKNISEYIEEDRSGHIERSAAPLREHADRTNSLTLQQRSEYFYGMTTVFPLMFLGHYYDWLDIPERKDYMAQFFPMEETRFGPVNRALLDYIVRSDSDAVWLSMLSGYLAYYPCALLEDFAHWALPEEMLKPLDSALLAFRRDTLPGMLEKLAVCCGDSAARVEMICWLGTQFPYELLNAFHCSLFGH